MRQRDLMDSQSHLPNAACGFDFMKGGFWRAVNRDVGSTEARLRRGNARPDE